MVMMTMRLLSALPRRDRSGNRHEGLPVTSHLPVFPAIAQIQAQSDEKSESHSIPPHRWEGFFGFPALTSA